MNRRIKAIRAFRGLRQVDLSKRTGIGQSRISLIEGGFSRIRDEEKRAIAEALGEKPEVLFPST